MSADLSVAVGEFVLIDIMEKPAAKESPATGFQNTSYKALVVGFDFRGRYRTAGIQVAQLAFDVGLQA